jgi:hypothetical protein
MSPPSEHWLARTLKLRGYRRGRLMYHGMRMWSSGRIVVLTGDTLVSVELLPGEGDEPAGWKVTFTGGPPRPIVRLVLDVAEMADSTRAAEIAAEIDKAVRGEAQRRGRDAGG